MLLSDISSHRNKRKGTLEAGEKVPVARPTIVIVPPNLIMQWANAIREISADLIVKVYYGGKRRRTAGEVEYIGGLLTKNSAHFEATEETARTMIIIHPSKL